MNISDFPPGTIGIISSDLSRYSLFCGSLLNLQYPKGTHFEWIIGTGFAKTRNQIVKRMKGEWLWFIDDDHTFDSDILLRLLARETDVIQPFTTSRQIPFHPYAYKLVDGVLQNAQWDEIPKEGLSVWDAVGLGGTLIDRAVLDEFEQPVFKVGRLAPDSIGEDLSFCLEAGQLGFTCWIDSDVKMGHMTPSILKPKWVDNRWVIDVQVLESLP